MGTKGLVALTLVLLEMLLAIVLFAPVDSFNVDTHNYVKHRGNPNSMFGFSVALHRENSNSWVIIGAPLAQTTQPGVERGGAVYRCDIARDDTCSLIEFDMKGNINDSDGKQVDMKSYQWFGATVRSSGEDGIILACAPRYIWFSTHLNRRDPVGTCYVAKNQFTEFAEYSPCRTRNWGYHRQGSCQAGLGASVSRDGRRLYVGAVGSWYWQGQVHSIDAFARLLFVPPRYTIIEEGQVISQSTHARPDVISTREGPSTDDDSYLGYSVTVGEFGGGSGGFNDVAVGMPRGAGLLGKIVLYNWNMTNIKNFTGEQLGAYFGYSLAACDIDGDGSDDIIVGAPLYTDLSNNKGHYETGRVYILFQGIGDYLWRDIQIRDGVNSRSRFGLSLTSLGDLNLDGFADFAVGAPYDGPKERGAVYIFLGSKRGVSEKPSQIIYSEQVVGQPSTFGFSLAGGIDLDENLYPDLLVGAYESETAVFLRSRPVVRVEASLAFLLPSKQISLEEKNCTLKDRTKVPCVELNTCLKYTGTNVDKRIEFEIQFILDSKKPHSPRLFFLSEEGRNSMNQTIRLEKNNQFCKKTFAYIKPNIRDKLTSLEAEMRYGLKASEMSATRRVARLLHPILDQTQQEGNYKKDIILIQKDCGKDNICIPDLRLIATPSVNKYLLGSGDRLEIDVEVQNEGEDAFEAIYELQVPSGLNYVKIEKVEPASKDLLPVLCSAPSYFNNNTLHCDIGNPLPKQKIVHFKVVLQPYRLEGLKPRYEFFMSVNSTNPENSTSLSDNQMHFRVPIWVETDLIVHGSTSSGFYNVSQFPIIENITQESQIGPAISHIYSIRNKGPSDIIEAEAYILWPSYTLAGEHLFYLTEQPEVSENVQCELVEEVNTERINMEKRRKSQYDTSMDSAVHSSLTGYHQSSGTHSSSSGSSSGGSYTSSSSSWSSSSSSSSGRNRSGNGGLSIEEKKRLEEAARRKEELTGEVGDASERHRERWRQTHRGGTLESDAHTGRSDGHGTTWKNQTSWSSSSFQSGHGPSSSGRVETSSSGQSGSWSSSGSGRISSSETDRSNTNYGTSLGRDVIIDTRGSGMVGGSWSGASAYDIAATGIPIDTRHRVRYNESRSEPKPQFYPSESSQGERWSGSGRIDENWRGRTPVANDSRYEERHYERNTTWNSGDKRPQVSSTWAINRDGVIERGSHRGEADVTSDNRDESYFGNREKGWNETWMISENNSNRGIGGYESAYEHRGSYNRPVGSHNFTEERTMRNTTWTSRGGPAIVSERSSWSINQNGTVRNGSQSRVYHDKDGYSRENIGLDISKEIRDRNAVRGGGGSKIYSEDREVYRNTSWSTADGKPISEDRRHWRVDHDGVVSSGSSSRTYEGNYESERGSNRDEYGVIGTSGSHSISGSHEEHSSHGMNEGKESDRSFTHSSRGQSERRDESETRSEDESGQSHSSREEHDRRKVQEASWSRTATNTNIGDLLNNRRTGSGFGGLGDIAVGPKDGVARTYTLDLGMLDAGNKEAVSSEQSGYRSGGGGFRTHTSESSGERHSSGSGGGSRSSGWSGSTGGSSYRSESRGSGSGGMYTGESSGEVHASSSRGGSREGFSSSSSRHYESRTSEDSGRGSGSVRSGSHYSSSRSGGFSATHNDDDGGYNRGSSSSYESRRRGSSSGQSSNSWSYSSSSGVADGDSPLHRERFSRRSDHVSSSQGSHNGPRSRRQVDDVDDFDSYLDCGTTKCTRIRCTVGPLKKDEEAFIKLKSRAWVHNLQKMAGWNKVNVSSKLVARVSKLPHIGKPDVSTIKNVEVITQVVPLHPPAKPEVVPLWIIVLSACAGAILLMLLIFILYKLGFFKRNRPSTSPEKQPLNRNGHYQPGDEAL